MEENKQPRIIIIGLGNINRDEIMEIFYNLIISAPSDILNYEENTDSKIEKLNGLLEFFEEREQFEKCAEIKKVKELIILNDIKNGKQRK